MDFKNANRIPDKEMQRRIVVSRSLFGYDIAQLCIGIKSTYDNRFMVFLYCILA